MLSRQVDFGRAAADGRIPVVVSTEAPYERFDCDEILDHSPGAVDLSRAPLPLIEVHDNQRLPIGLVEDLRVSDRKLRGFVRFGGTDRAKEVRAEIESGIIRHVSVGYWHLDQGTPVPEVSRNALKFKFKPFEVSVVPVPADIGAGFFRSKDINMDNPQQQDDDEGGDKLTRSQRRAAARHDLAESERVQRITAIGAQYSKYVSSADVHRAVAEAHEVEQFTELIMKRMETRATDTRYPAIANDANLEREIGEKYSLRRAILASVDPNYARQAGFELEIAQELQRDMPTAASGLLVPVSILAAQRRDVTVGTGSPLVATDLRSDLYADNALRALTKTAALGARVLNGLQGNFSIPRKTAGMNLGWLTEVGSASSSDMTLDDLDFVPKRVSGYTVYSRQMLVQSGLPLENLVRDDFLGAFGAIVDDAAINGVGTGANPRGIRFTTGIGTVVGGANGAQVSWAHIVGLESAPANANSSAEAMAGYLVNSKTRGWLKTQPKGTALEEPIWPDARPGPDGFASLNGLRAAVSNNVPGNLTKGTATTVCSSLLYSDDWSQLILAYWGSSDIVVDPYTYADTGKIKVTINQFVDVGVRRPAAFSKMDDGLTS